MGTADLTVPGTRRYDVERRNKPGMSNDKTSNVIWDLQYPVLGLKYGIEE